MSTINTKKFADNLQELITNSGKTIKALAKEIGISSGALSKYQNDAAEAGIDALSKIADYFDVSTDFLLGKSNDPKRKATAIDDIGLSPEAVNALTEMSKQKESMPYQFYLLNAILTHPEFQAILFGMAEIQLTADSKRKYPDLLSRQTPARGAGSLKAARAINNAFSAAKGVLGDDYNIITGEKGTDFALFVTQQRFGKILESVAAMPPFWQLDLE